MSKPQNFIFRGFTRMNADQSKDLSLIRIDLC